MSHLEKYKGEARIVDKKDFQETEVKRMRRKEEEKNYWIDKVASLRQQGLSPGQRAPQLCAGRKKLHFLRKSLRDQMSIFS